MRALTSTDLGATQALLRSLNLPTVGVQPEGFVVAEEDGEVVALAGLEVHGRVGLLRSVAVRPEQRSRGVARRLVEHIIQRARDEGLGDLYLLTTTAAGYFPRFGFQPRPRSLAPAALNASPEFQGVCPESATLMHLPLEEIPMPANTAPAPVQPIPGLNEGLSTADLLDALRAAPQRPLEFWLEGRPLVPPGYHTTEIKAVTIEAMDCGGRAAAWRETVIQLMDGSAEEARAGFMSTRKFLAIYDRVARHIPVKGEAEVRFEYGNALSPALQYHVLRVEAQLERVVVHLRTPGVQCKAQDACGTPASAQAGAAQAGADACAPDTGCCAPQSPVQLG
ncbi:arsenic resistance N-acetyltransferase ArsN2 [Deinococcus koreensis]|uniref:N-acetyltransferase domain-containing protein n=1 Tax=Deinococcus koreensis TaxID=2054903 RepID=A0A2K3UWL9_9DEIO|nr:arsenic resistance N-acetyltransferase ArsN2 [Deinococcus koreensis]PNY80932.1 hypothetical protein CVO96_05700 [Deinococcus koreensis]